MYIHNLSVARAMVIDGLLTVRRPVRPMAALEAFMSRQRQPKGVQAH